MCITRYIDNSIEEENEPEVRFIPSLDFFLSQIIISRFEKLITSVPWN